MVKISFKIGSLSGAGKADYSTALEAFEDEIQQKVVTRAVSTRYVNVARLRTLLDLRVTKSLTAAVRFAATTMVGVKSSMPGLDGTDAPATPIIFDWEDLAPIARPSPGELRDRPNAQTLLWKSLARSTIARKARMAAGSGSTKTVREAALRHFVDTGQLQQALLSLSRDIVSKTGTVQIEYKSDENVRKYSKLRSRASRIKVGHLCLVYVPRLKTRMLPGLQFESVYETDPNMAFEQSLGFTGPLLGKLKGVHGRHRPLLQPVFTYWILSRLPRVTAGAIKASIAKDLY